MLKFGALCKRMKSVPTYWQASLDVNYKETPLGIWFYFRKSWPNVHFTVSNEFAEHESANGKGLPAEILSNAHEIFYDVPLWFLLLLLLSPLFAIGMYSYSQHHPRSSGILLRHSNSSSKIIRRFKIPLATKNIRSAVNFSYFLPSLAITGWRFRCLPGWHSIYVDFRPIHYILESMKQVQQQNNHHHPYNHFQVFLLWHMWYFPLTNSACTDWDIQGIRPKWIYMKG